MNRERWMGVCFAAGATCFLVGPFPGYASLVGDAADAVTFFVARRGVLPGVRCRDDSIRAHDKVTGPDPGL